MDHCRGRTSPRGLSTRRRALWPTWLTALALGLAAGQVQGQPPAQPPTENQPAAQPPADKPPVEQPKPQPEAKDKPEQGPAQPAAPPKPPPRLFEREPYDVITLDKANEYAVRQTLPLDFPNRQLPARAKQVGKLRVRLLQQPDEEYEVAWKNIEKIEFFEELVLRDAQGLVAQAAELATAGKLGESQAKFDEAFDYYQFLLRMYPQTPGLPPAVQAYLFANAGVLFKQKRVAEAFAVLEELYRQNKDFQPSGSGQTVVAALDRVGERLVSGYVESGNFPAARGLLERLVKDYGDALKLVPGLRDRLRADAAKKRDEAAAHFAAQRFREAHDASREMLAIWPRVEGGSALIAQIARRYPLIVVGVTQPAVRPDAERLDDWAARRTGRLMFENLLEFSQPGPDGGQYTCPFATVQQSDDRRQLIFEFPEPTAQGSDSADRLPGFLLSLADPASASYRPHWASVMAGVRSSGAHQLIVDLRRPHVLPQALLQTPWTVGGQPVLRYRAVSPAETESRFEPVAAGRDTQDVRPVIIERPLPDPRKALDALRKGKVDILDRLLPTDARRLEQDATLQVGRYAFPTLHVLVPNRANPFLASRIFRRALTYGINREVILNRGLLNGPRTGCQVISAPLSAGIGENDPTAYAYDARIPPLPYDPVMATVMIKLTEQQLASAADARKEAAPELQPLVLAHPAGEIPKFACQKIRAQLQPLEIKCELRELPAGQIRPSSGEADLLYLELQMYEPLVDAARIFGPGGLLPAADPYVQLALRQIEQADNWKLARERLQELHRLLHEDVTVIPLWQMVDFFAYRRGVEGLPKRPAYFYQDVGQWRVIPYEAQP